MVHIQEEAVSNCIVVGESWVAKAIAEHLSTTAVGLKKIMFHNHAPWPVIIHADASPNLDFPLRAWEWVLRTLAMRQMCYHCHWIQCSSVEVLAGTNRKRPYGAAAEVRPLGLKGQVGASLEWGLQSLGHSLAIVRSGLLYDDGPGRLLQWARDLVQAGFGRAPFEFISPTPIDLFAGAVEKLAESRKEGIYHAACQGQAPYVHIISVTADYFCRFYPVVDYAPDGPINLSLTSTTKLGHWLDVYLERLRLLTKAS
jgi:hypothetical protein